MPALLPLRRVLPCLGLALLLQSTPARPATDLGLPETTAAAAGFSGARLQRLAQMFEREIAAGHYAGVTWLVARDGKVFTHGAVGFRSVAAQTPMTEDTVCRIFSMTKIVTTVTFLTLLEEGRVNLADPVELYLPELAHRQVLVGGTAAAPQLEPATGPITLRHLLTHTSGLTYDIFATGTLRELWVQADLWHSPDLPGLIHRIAALPLAHQPGAKWTYGVNTDVLGAVIEKVTGQDLETAMRSRVLGPLGMHDTTFRPGAEQLARLATIHHRTEDGKLEPEEKWSSQESPKFLSGGGGLVSTLHDYARFAQMLLNGGQLDGVRILGPKTVEVMTHDQIGELARGAWTPPGFGFGVSVRPAYVPEVKALGSAGEYGWDGLCDTFVSIDPQEHLVLLMFMQHSPWDDGGIFERFSNTVYQALEH